MKTQCEPKHVRPFLDGQLNPERAAAFELHLDRCETCQQQLDSAVASGEEWAELRSSLSATTVVPERSRTTADADDLTVYRRMLSPSDDPSMLGRVGNYEVVGLLGRGGMGVVFKAMDPSLNRYVAIKMMAPQFSASGAARQRFSREAHAAAAIVHDNVVAIHSVSQWQDTPYLVMPYICGKSLQKRIDEDGALQLREILRIGYQVASALAAAHAQGLIHRDVKPANILLEQDVERVILTDFGLARTVDDIRLTRTDTLVGTPQYMSPEQAGDQSLDFRSDLFSLGSVLYEAATGRPAFQAVTSYGVLRKINDTEPPSIRDLNADIPDWLTAIIARLMAKDPSERFASAAEVADLLQRCLSHVEQPHLTPLPETLVEPVSLLSLLKRKKVMIATLASGTVAVAALLFAASGSNETPQPEGSAADAATANLPEATAPAAEPKDKSSEEYATAAQALQIGTAYAVARDHKRAKKPLEAAVKMASDDLPLKMKIYERLIPVYRELPEFEPFRDAAEFIIDNHYHGAAQSNMQRSLLSFAHNRGQLDNLVKRYEKQLKKDGDRWLPVFMLAEIYSASPFRSTRSNPKRAIEMLTELPKLDAKRAKDPKRNWSPLPASSLNNPAAPAQHKEKLAAQYVKLREYDTAAKLFEEAAGLHEATSAANLKDAASAAFKAGNKKDALRLALAAEEAPEGGRGDQALHHFHRNLGDTFMLLERPGKAIPHYEIAVKKTKIAGYIKDTMASLIEAKEKAGQE